MSDRTLSDRTLSGGMPTWPAWDRYDEPDTLVRYIHPDEVAALVQRRGDGSLGGLPGPGAGGRLDRAREIYDALTRADIRYADEPFAQHGQHVRAPSEVLDSPHNGNCLDLSVLYAAACLHAGLHPIVVILEPEHGPAHALVLVWLDGEWPGSSDDEYPLRDEPQPITALPAALNGAIRTEPDGHGAFLPVDVALVAGTAERGPADFTTAVGSAAPQLTPDRWSMAVDIGRTYDPERCYRVWPGSNPLEAPYADPERDQDPDTDRSPLQALWARFPTVRFTRRPELLLLSDFFELDGTDPDAIRVAVVHGTGGSGKTRLAAELAHRLAGQRGWITGFLPRNIADDDLGWLARTVTPLLVVVDYAEAARETELQQLFRTLRRDRRGQRTGVLLTARTLPEEPASWWGKLGSLLAAPPITGTRHVLGPQETALNPRHPDPDRLFDRAYRSFGGEGGQRAAPRGPWSTLDLVMQAWLRAYDPDAEVPRSAKDLYDKILKHEIRHWNGAYERRFDAGAPPEMSLRQVLSCVTAVGPTSSQRLDAILRACPALDSGDRARFVELVPGLLPADGDGALRLQPDPVGDHLAATTFSSDLEPAEGLTEEESRPLLLRCLDRCTGGERLNVFWLITRAEQTDRDAAVKLAEQALHSNGIPERKVHWELAYDTALAIGGPFAPALAQLAQAPDSPLPLHQLASAIPLGHSALGELAAVAAQHVVDIAPSGDDIEQLAARATALNTAGVRLSEAGRRDDALAPTEEAVTIRRRLAETQPAAYLPDLAMSLNNLGIRLSEAGRRDDALTATEEAVTLYRRLAETQPAAYLPNLAASLNNLGIRLSEAGRRGDALAPTEEAVTIRRRLAETQPAAYLPDLAMSLTNLGNRLSEVGSRGDALTATEEAVTIRRRLAETQPAAYLPDLAMSLNNLGIRLSEAGRRGDALTATEEAVTLYRRLADTQPAAYLPDLARSLNNLGIRLSEAGRRADALAPTEEAVTLYRRLADTQPAAYLPDLAGSLTNLGNHLSEVGRRADALTATEEAVTLYRRLAETQPAACLPDLAGSLNNLGIRLSEAGRRADALAPTEEAVTLYRRLAEHQPAAYLPDLAMSLNNLGAMLSEAGRRADALAPTEEAVTIRRRLAEHQPTAYLPNLAMSLTNLGAMLSEAGRRADALAPTEEAVTLYRRLAEHQPAAYLPDLAASLNNLGNHLSEVGRRADALAATEEAVTIRRRLAGTQPAAYLPDLARSLNNLGIQLSEAGRRADALAPTEEAVTIRRRLADTQPAAYLPDLAASLTNLGNRLSEAGRRADALAAFAAVADGLRPTSAAWIWAARALFRHNLDKEAAPIDDLRDAASAALADDDPRLAGAARRRVREITRAILGDGPVPEDIPQWALLDLDDAIIDLANSWAAAARWRERETLLRDNIALLESGADTLHALVVLYPEYSAPPEIAQLVAAIDEHGIEVLAEYRSALEHRELLDDWIRTPDWRASREFLADENVRRAVLDDARTSQVLARLAGFDQPDDTGDPAAAQHLGIVLLARPWPLPDVFDVVTDIISARDAALDAVQDGRVELLQPILLAAPQLASMPGYGAFLIAILLLDTGDPDAAVQRLTEAMTQAGPQDQEMLKATLRRLATHRDDVGDLLAHATADPVTTDS